MSAGAIFLAIGMYLLDRRWPMQEEFKLPLLYGGGPEGARSVLSLVASSMITVTGVVFSITIVALTLASQQFGPRLLRNFMKDRGNQIVLGTFLATFIYCILILPSIHTSESGPFVPYFSVNVGVLLTLLSLVVLIYFIHHIPALMQVSTVVDDVTRTLLRTIREFRPEKWKEDSLQKIAATEPDEELRKRFLDEGKKIRSNFSGYLQAIDYEGLRHMALELDLQIWIRVQAGHFVIKNSPIALVIQRGENSEALREVFNDKLIFGIKRTETQDIEYAISELVEIALRALSPGINDPRTAVNCIDRLAEGIAELAARRIDVPRFEDETGTLRVLGQTQTFRSAVDEAYNEIRQIARGNAAVCLRLLEVFREIGELAVRTADREVIRVHADMVIRSCRESLQEKCDLEQAEARYQEFTEFFEAVS